MTLPVPQGYPDYLRKSALSDQVLVNDTRTGATGTVSYPVQYVANIPALWFFFSASLLGAKVIFNWYLDAAGTNLLGQSSLEFGPSSSGNRSFRPITSYVRLQVVPSAGTGLNYTLIVMSLTDVNSSKLSMPFINLLNQSGVAIGASVTSVFVSGVVHVGEAVWSAFCTANVWIATLELVGFTGTTTIIDRCDWQDNKQTCRPVWLGGGVPQIRMQNGDAANKFLNVSLNASTNIFA